MLFGKLAQFQDGGAVRAVVWSRFMGKYSIFRNLRALLLMFCFLHLAATGFAAEEKGHKASAGEKIIFKRLPAAILKIDGKQVKFWEVYQADKRGHLLLVQLGRRYLLLDSKEREILEIDPSAIENKPKGNEVVWTRTPENESKLESDAWSVRNVGPALAIKVLLSAEGRLLELQLPLRPDERRQW